MGERKQLHPGDQAPNDGIYMETGVNDFHMGIENPATVELKKGDKLPETTNHERVWRLTRKGR